MSMRRICDCQCHDEDDCVGISGLIEPGDNYDTFDDVDVCNDCLIGRYGCKAWSAFTHKELTPTQKNLADVFSSIYAPVIEEQLKSQVQFLNRFGK